MSENSIERLDWPDLLRLPLMIGVVFVHNFDPVNAFGYGLVSLQGRDGFADVIMFYISQVVGRLSVPIFFYFSGYFFYRQLASGGLARWAELVKKRFRSLFVPFLVWNLLTLLAFFVVQKVGIAGSADARIGNLSNMDLIDVFKVFIGTNGFPIAYQFWFIRDLMLCVVLSALIFRLSTVWFALLTLGMIFLWGSGFSPLLYPTSPAVVFFLIGGLSYKFRGSLIVERFSVWCVALYVVISIIDAATRGQSGNEFLHRIGLLVGLASTYWFAIGVGRFAAIRDFSQKYSDSAFFVFAFHEPLLTLVKKILFITVAKSTNSLLIFSTYFGAPIIVVAISLAAWSSLKRYQPKLLGFLTGGR